MRGESSQKRNNGSGAGKGISNSRAMGIIVLIALLLVFQVVTFIWQKVRVASAVREVEAVGAAGGFVAASVAGGASGAGGARGGTIAVGSRFAFDPNTITGDSLQLLGFSPRQAQSILKYRSKGGKFRYKEDFARLYVVDSMVYALLEEYLLLPRRESGTKGAGNVPGGAAVGTKRGISVPEGAKNGVAGTKGAGKVPETDSSGRREYVYGKKVERNRYMCNLNTADSAALVKLYGIGGYYARKILNYRERLGGSFVDVRQLLEIEGFTQERFSGIQGNIFVNVEDLKPISILDAGREFLERHPYIGPYAARGIVTYVKLKGKDAFASEFILLEQLVKEMIITKDNADKLRGYLLPL